MNCCACTACGCRPPRSIGRQTVLVAFREVSDALIAQTTLVDQRTALEGQVAALKDAVDLSLLRYNAGRASYFEVLEAEQLVFPRKTRSRRLSAIRFLSL